VESRQENSPASGLFLGFRAERFSAEPSFRAAKWNPCPSARFFHAPTRGVSHSQGRCADSNR